MRLGSWDKTFYYKALGKRLESLLIPLLLWNTIFFVGYWGKNYLFMHLGLEPDEHYLRLETFTSFEEMLYTSVDTPLWFVRDLLWFALLSPLFYCLCRYLRWVAPLLLYIYQIFFPYLIPGVSILSTGAFVFCLGVYLALYGHTFLALCRKLFWVALPLAVGINLANVYYYGTLSQEILGQLTTLAIPFGIITIIGGFDKLFRSFPQLEKCALTLAPMSFFVYAINELYILHWTKGLLARLPFFGSAGWGQLASYFLVPLIVIAICVGIYMLLKRISPTILGILIGGRVNNQG